MEVTIKPLIKSNKLCCLTLCKIFIKAIYEREKEKKKKKKLHSTFDVDNKLIIDYLINSSKSSLSKLVGIVKRSCGLLKCSIFEVQATVMEGLN